MNKKRYEKPSVEVVVLKQELMLPEASVGATLGGFTNETASRKSKFVEIEFPDEDFSDNTIKP